MKPELLYRDLGILQVTGRGLLPPQINTATRTAFAAQLGVQDRGIIVYDIEDDTLYLWDGTAFAALSSSTPAAPATVKSLYGFIETPSDKTYTLQLRSAVDGTINSLAIITASGTLDATIEINGTPVTGLGAVAVSNVIAEPAATALNIIAVGDVVALIVSNNAAGADLAFTLNIT